MNANSPQEGAPTTLLSLMYRLERSLRPFRRDEVRKLPEDRYGVYALWLPTGVKEAPECLYVGVSTTCLRRRLLDHLSRETNPQLRAELRLFRDVVLFSAAFTAGAPETFALETSVIRRWKPRTNRAKLE